MRVGGAGRLKKCLHGGRVENIHNLRDAGSLGSILPQALPRQCDHFLETWARQLPPQLWVQDARQLLLLLSTLELEERLGPAGEQALVLAGYGLACEQLQQQDPVAANVALVRCFPSS